MFRFLKTLSRVNSKDCSYIIYLHYIHPEKQALCWRKICSSHTKKHAMRRAKRLQDKKQYDIIEIQKKFFCKEQDKFLGKTIRTLSLIHI